MLLPIWKIKIRFLLIISYIMSITCFLNDSSCFFREVLPCSVSSSPFSRLLSPRTRLTSDCPRPWFQRAVVVCGAGRGGRPAPHHAAPHDARHQRHRGGAVPLGPGRLDLARRPLHVRSVGPAALPTRLPRVRYVPGSRGGRGASWCFRVWVL